MLYTSFLSHDQAVHSRTQRVLSLATGFGCVPEVVDLVARV